MTGLQAACDHAITKEWDLTHIETVSQRVYDTIGQQDMIMLNDDQLEGHGENPSPPFVMGNLILGDGEVVDGPPPPPLPPKKRRFELVNTVQMDKGKDKVLAHYAFGNNGALRPEAVKIIDSGKLTCYSDEFAKKVINLDAVVGNGIYAKDVLHHALKGTLQKIIKRLYVTPKPADHLKEISGFMTVEQVLAMMGLAPDEDSSSKASGSGDA
ncbi:hypothetical protein ACET3Z_011024 [Daucus carota]